MTDGPHVAEAFGLPDPGGSTSIPKYYVSIISIHLGPSAPSLSFSFSRFRTCMLCAFLMFVAGG
jgi:hypothetical protein